jgi:hypothetical protein
VFARLISHKSAVLFSQNKPVTGNQAAVLFSQNKPAPAISQPNKLRGVFCDMPLKDVYLAVFYRKCLQITTTKAFFSKMPLRERL